LGSEDLSAGTKRSAREAESLSSAEINDDQIYNCTPLCAFMSCIRTSIFCITSAATDN